MTQKQIEDLIYGHYPIAGIAQSEIVINTDTNQQLDYLQIIFFPDYEPDLSKIGHLIQDLDTLTMNDDYGDMTELTFSYTTLFEWEDTVTIAFTFQVNIDS